MPPSINFSKAIAEGRSHPDEAMQLGVNDHPLAALISRLNRRFTEPVLSMGAAGPGWTSVADLCRPGSVILADLLAYQSSFTEGLGARGEAAYFVGQYSRLLALATVPPLLMADLIPDLAPDRLALWLEPYPLTFDGRTIVGKRVHLRFLDDSFWTIDASLAQVPGARIVGDRNALLARFREAIEAHFQPLIDRVRVVTRLPAVAQWRLVGDSFGAVFLEVGQKTGSAERATSEAVAVLKHPLSPLHNRQMHFFELELAGAGVNAADPLRQTFRARGGCCRFYTAKGGRLCSTCVLRDPASRDAILLDSMRRQSGGAITDIDQRTTTVEPILPNRRHRTKIEGPLLQRLADRACGKAQIEEG